MAAQPNPKAGFKKKKCLTGWFLESTGIPRKEERKIDRQNFQGRARLGGTPQGGSVQCKAGSVQLRMGPQQRKEIPSADSKLFTVTYISHLFSSVDAKREDWTLSNCKVLETPYFE